jgi:hypothetical protein
MFWWIEECKLVKITFRLQPFFVLSVLIVRNVLNYKCSVVTCFIRDGQLHFFSLIIAVGKPVQFERKSLAVF